MRVWHVYLTPRAGSVNGVIGAMRTLADAQGALGVDASLVLARPGSGYRTRHALRDALRALHGPHAPDLVHFHEVNRPPHRVLAGALARRGIPFVVSPHSGLAPENLARYRVRKGAYGALVERRLLRRAAGICCLTPVERDDVHRYLGPVPTELLPNALTREAVAGTPRRVTRPTKRVVTLCRFDVRQKGLDRLASIAHRLPDVSFAVYGSADGNEPERLRALERDRPPNLRLCAPVRAAEKVAVLEAATCFVQPSRWEGLSVALTEALAAGLPTAVSTYVGRTLPYADRGLGLVLPDDPALAAPALAAFLSDPVRLERASRNGIAYARSELDPTVVGRRSLEVYTRLLADSSAAAAANAARTTVATGLAEPSTRSNP